eukprot:CAMPEP_0178742886 /NCGR_PEP_ID=MMETSP0744-20121128/5914_1 /TAXON_ID=913974 /ORGANISM="Nitzschia punctata, Strain CCMP561" /LENGTH=542 /DNA_ID=CAMNT_0020395859 /DNA_START=153 /DNA_END=1778 /DNA_ORIENTATION=-
MAAARLVSYWSLMGLSVQTSRWEQAMNRNLLEMSQALDLSSSLQATASEQEAMAAENEESAASQELEAKSLQEEAAALLEESEVNTGISATDTMQAEALAAEISTEEAEATAHLAKAAVEEGAADTESAEALADAAEAARIEAQAHGEEIGIAICEFIPILDIACDIVGGVTAVGLEAGASVEAIKAAGETAEVVASKAEEEREVALAAEIEGKVVEDGAAEAELESEATEKGELAEEERLEAEAKEAAADGLLEEAEAEEVLAEEEEAAAADDEALAAGKAGEAIEKSVIACWNGILATACGLLSFAFFSIRAIFNFIVPGFRQVWIGVAKISGSSSASSTSPSNLLEFQDSLARDASYVFHHFAIFMIVGFTFHSLLSGLGNNSLRARGGILLCFASTCAIVQSVALHVLPNGVAKVESACQVVLHFFRRVIVLSLLFTIEILLIWVVFGSEVFPKIPDFANLVLVLLWMFLVLSLAVHISLLELPRLTSHFASTCSENEVCHESDVEESDVNSNLPTEQDPLISKSRSSPEDGYRQHSW